jgi:hypothetical protein
MNAALEPLASAIEAAPPWLSPYTAIAQQVLAAASCQSVAAALNAARGHSANSKRFVEQSALPVGEPYESFIARTSSIPTRDNLHDLFNGLMWLAYPKTKARLNSVHARAIEEHGASGPRGPLRDALTVFDENAALLRAPADLVEALRLRDWKALFLERREQWRWAQLVVFGHALLEKLIYPRKPITAHVWIVEKLEDEAVASTLDVERLTTAAFVPLPVLGVPGWWAANEDPTFYDDATVFRPPRL